MSGIPSYPLPTPPEHTDEIDALLAGQASSLRPVLVRLGEEVTSGLVAQEAALDKVTRALKRRIQSELRGQVKALVPVMDAIHGQIAGSLAAQQVALSTLLDQAPTGYPTTSDTSGLPIAPPVQETPPSAPAGTGYQLPPPDPSWSCGPNPAVTHPDLYSGCVVEGGVWRCALRSSGASVLVCEGGTAPSPPADQPSVPSYPIPAPAPAPETPPTPQSPFDTIPPGVPHEPLPPRPEDDWGTSPGADLPLVPNWCDPLVCDTLQQVTEVGAFTGGAKSLAEWLGNLGSKDPDDPAGWLVWTLGKLAGIPLSVASVGLQPILGWIDREISTHVVGPDCSPAQILPVAVTRFVVSALRKYLGDGLQPLDRKLEYWVNSYCPTELPSPDESDAAYLAGTITADQWTCWVKAQGRCDLPRQAVVRAQRTRPSVADELSLWMRGAATDEELAERLRQRGVLDESDLERFKGLTLQLPSPSEVIQWVVREAFDLDVVRALGYDREIPDVARPVFEAQGMRGVFPRVGSETGATDTADHLTMTWAAHWLPISPQQAFEMLHRIRLDNFEEYRQLGLNVQPFELADVQRWLRIADYPPGIRDYLAAIAYRPLRLVDVRNGLILGIRDEEWAYKQFLSRGYSPRDADYSAQLAVRQAEEKKLAPVRAAERKAYGLAISEALEAYEVGYLDRNGCVAVLTGAGISPEAAEVLVNGRDASAGRKLVTRAVNAVRRDYLSGALTLAEAGRSLVAAGIQPPQAQRYLTAWSVELGHTRRVTSTQTAVSWHAQGLISRDEAARRLANLGWSQPDVLLWLTEAQVKADKLRAQQLAAAQQTARRQAADLERLQRRLEKQRADVQRRLAKLSPVSKLQKWAVAGIISEAFFRTRMTAMGYDLASINQHWAEVQVKLEEQNAETTSNGQAAQAPA